MTEERLTLLEERVRDPNMWVATTRDREIRKNYEWLIAEVRRLREDLGKSTDPAIVEKLQQSREEMVQKIIRLEEEARIGPWVPEDEVARMLKEARAAALEEAAKIADADPKARHIAAAIRGTKDKP